MAKPLEPSTKVRAFAQKAYEDTKGPTDDLKRAYAAYLDNEKKVRSGAGGRQP